MRKLLKIINFLAILPLAIVTIILATLISINGFILAILKGTTKQYISDKRSDYNFIKFVIKELLHFNEVKVVFSKAAYSTGGNSFEYISEKRTDNYNGKAKELG